MLIKKAKLLQNFLTNTILYTFKFNKFYRVSHSILLMTDNESEMATYRNVVKTLNNTIELEIFTYKYIENGFYCSHHGQIKTCGTNQSNSP